MKIAVFGGSFDPFHKSHLEIINWCKEVLKFDEVWIVLAYQNPFKANAFSTPEQRLEIIKIVSNNLDFVKIIDFELKRSKPTPTYLTVKYLQDKYKGNDYSFIIGMDILKDFEKWQNFKKLIKMINFIVFRRDGYEYSDIAEKYKFTVIDFPNSQLSSTELRQQKSIESQLEIVNLYVQNNFLYYQNKLATTLTPGAYKKLEKAIIYFELLFSPFAKNYWILRDTLLISYTNFQLNKDKPNFAYLADSLQTVQAKITVDNDFNRQVLANLTKLANFCLDSYDLKKLFLVLSYANCY